MQKEKKTRLTSFSLNIVFFTVGQYLKDIFVYVHMIICNSSPETFAFLMIVIVAIVISYLKIEK